MLTNLHLPPLSALCAGLNSSRTRCIKISPRLSHLPKQITRLSSTYTPKLSNIFQPSIVNSGTASEITIPRIIYSTSRKGEKTEHLVYQAIQAGYRGIETGAEPLKYEEKLAGDGIRRAIERGIVERSELYIQTTFAPPEGQNLQAIPTSVKGEKTLEEVREKLPYSFSSPIAEQIHTSIASSLKNLKASNDEKDPYIDCLILRSPYPTREETREAWDVLSTYVPHPIRSLGIASKKLMGIGEESFMKGEEEKSIIPSVYVNTLKKHDGAAIGFDLDNYPKKDMVFQSSWSTNDMTHVAQNALTFEICCILQELNCEQGESRKFAMHVLLLALKLHGLVILEEGNNIKTMYRDMKALKRLAKYIQKRKGRLRWARLERSARMFFEGMHWEQELQRPYTEPEPGDEHPDAKADIHAPSSQERDIDAVPVAASALSLNPTSPIPNIPSPALTRYWPPTQTPENDLRGTLLPEPQNRSPKIETPNFPKINRVSYPPPISRSSHSSPLSPSPPPQRETSAMRKSTYKREIDRLVREGCSPSEIAKVVREQREEARRLRKEIVVKRQRWGTRGR